jgi:hypothetical protein
VLLSGIRGTAASADLVGLSRQEQRPDRQPASRFRGSVCKGPLVARTSCGNLPAVVNDILRVVGKEWRGAVVYDRTADAADEGL